MSNALGGIAAQTAFPGPGRHRLPPGEPGARSGLGLQPGAMRIADRPAGHSAAGGVWLQFAILTAVLAGAGWLTEGAATRIGEANGLTGTSVGVLLTSVATSLPELVTTVAAVRRRALQLAVGGIISGNAFDCLFVAA